MDEINTKFCLKNVINLLIAMGYSEDDIKTSMALHKIVLQLVDKFNLNIVTFSDYLNAIRAFAEIFDKKSKSEYISPIIKEINDAQI